MTPNHRQSLGKWGEGAAAQYLANCGYQLFERNYRTPYGEIDLITRVDDTIVFVEVKTRASRTFGLPEISVTSQKRLHMIHCAEYYIQQHPEAKCSWRIDVIAVQRMASQEQPLIKHFKNAIA
jgi:putative endonuclease